MFEITGTYTDQYELAMSQVYFKKGYKDSTAVFDYFFRKLPFNSGYSIFAGLDDVIDILEDLHFNEQDIMFLKKQGFDPGFIDYLQDFSFSGNIYSVLEGDLVFPTRPVLQVEADLIEAQIIETLLLNILNFQTLVATKAMRMQQVACGNKLSDFGLRRAHSLGGYHAARAAIIGGFDSSSNVIAGRDFGLPVTGTMAHSFIQSYDDELTAFRDFAESHPGNTVLLVDTYDTLKSGIPNAIKVGNEMESKGNKLKGIRLDSGDLAYLSKKARKMLDDAGLGYVKIAASNQLDEFVIKSLMEQEAPIDLFGVGTSLVTGQPDAALDGVYKLAFAKGKPRIKLSETIEKTTLPDRKQVYRLRNDNSDLIGADAVALLKENDFKSMHHPFEPGKSMELEQFKKEPLLQKVMENGKRVYPKKDINEIKKYSNTRLKELPFEYKRFENPHIYKIGISDGLREMRDKLINERKKEVKS